MKTELKIWIFQNYYLKLFINLINLMNSSELIISNKFIFLINLFITFTNKWLHLQILFANDNSKYGLNFMIYIFILF
jgi:hypothetical protein